MTLNLDALIPSKKPVDTSIGTLYVRIPSNKDLETLVKHAPGNIGSEAIKTLVNRIEKKRDRSEISEQDLENLTDVDKDKLATAISQANSIQPMPLAHQFSELEASIKAAHSIALEAAVQRQDELRQSIERQYSFLNDSTRHKLQEQMTGLAALRDNGYTQEIRQAIKDMGPNAETMFAPQQEITRFVEKARECAAGEYQRHLEKAGEQAKNDALAQLDLPALEAAKLVQQISDQYPGHWSPKEVKTYSEAPRAYFPDPEKSKLGKAAIESAEHSRRAAEQTAALVQLVGDLNTTMVREILPAWMDKDKSDRQQQIEASEQAQKSLGLAITGLYLAIGSIAVSIGMTFWQVQVSREIDNQNSVQQQKTEDLMRDQLAAQKKLLEQQEKLLIEFQRRSVVQPSTTAPPRPQK
ncbi:hypothetical protein [Curvibacter lanceolatus]|uniref:hypothetical protein n=1 Tax=Curvibacter lanceolatus TaxID=86182 RepID=UPI0004CF031D|nr:hypothetical protein [Curvibacter lanceolatus]